MRALVVFESMFGNTRDVARAVAEGLGSHMEVDVVEVGSAPTEIGDDVSLLVAGAPTHAFSLSREQTRRSAAQQATRPLVSQGTGLREWLASVTRTGGSTAAAFDTRVDRPRLPGSAARKAGRRLKRRGFPLVTGAESFWVHGTEGPLVDGEIERARRWGDTVGARLEHRAAA